MQQSQSLLKGLDLLLRLLLKAVLLLLLLNHLHLLLVHRRIMAEQVWLQ